MRTLRLSLAAVILLASSITTGTVAQTPAEPASDTAGQRLVNGREVIDAMLARSAPETQWGYVTQHHGWEKTLSLAIDDPWVSGTGRYAFDVDIIGAAPDAAGNMRGGVARDRGTLRIENDGGAWEGPCDGATTDGGEHMIGSCVLTGSGAYEGYTCVQVHDWGLAGTAQGVIFAGEFPSAYPTLPPMPGS